MTGGPRVMSNCTPLPVVWAFCVALIVALNVPIVVGVPETTPVDVLMESPGGKPDALNVVSDGQFGVYVVVYAADWKTPVCPVALAELEIAGPTVGPAMNAVNERWWVVPAFPDPRRLTVSAPVAQANGE